ncbi:MULTISPECIES: PIN domain-containing protein [Rhodomicrobium]|uniref:PIN domain-containing protein n=1 Tax=Rhodomicrobium TaxID=1068 RepID=UPI000B4A9F4E|nr:MULTISPECIES: PIN domain-containing protein [Rhodomicrobium]
MSEVRPFFDTNILLYLLSDEDGRADTAGALLQSGGVVSVQVLNEFASVAKRKFGMDWEEIAEILDVVKAVCSVVPVAIDTHELGISIARRYGFTVYDGMIWAAALLTGCPVLYSEDMQNCFVIDGTVLQNPYAKS